MLTLYNTQALAAIFSLKMFAQRDIFNFFFKKCDFQESEHFKFKLLQILAICGACISID